MHRFPSAATTPLADPHLSVNERGYLVDVEPTSRPDVYRVAVSTWTSPGVYDVIDVGTRSQCLAYAALLRAIPSELPAPYRYDVLGCDRL